MRNQQATICVKESQYIISKFATPVQESFKSVHILAQKQIFSQTITVSHLQAVSRENFTIGNGEILH